MMKSKKILKVLPWQAAQVLLIVVFLWAHNNVESTVLNQLIGEAVPDSLLPTEQYLRGELFFLIPGKAWHAFVPLAFLAFGFLFLARLRWYFLGLFGFATLLLAIADRIAYDFFSALVSVQSLSAAHQIWDVRDSVFASIRWLDLVFLLIMLAMPVFGWQLNRRMNPTLKKGPLMFSMDKLWGVILFGVCLHVGFTAFQLPLARFADAQESTRDQKVDVYFSSSRFFALHFGLYNYHVKDLVSSVYKSLNKRPLDPRQLKIAYRTLKRSKAANDIDSPLFGAARGRNVIVISMEAFQHYLLDLEVEDQVITPNLNSLRTSALDFDYCLDNVSKGGTSDAEFSFLTGLLADPEKIIAMSMNTDQPPISISQTLADVGYHTISMHGYDPTFWNRNINHPALGFQEMKFKNEYETELMLVPDIPFFQQSGDYLRNIPSPFFAFLISISSHHPYSWVEANTKTLKLSMQNSQARKYLEAARYADEGLGTFVKGLKENGLWQNSLIVIYGDHAASLDPASRNLMKEVTGIAPFSIRETRVPLLICIPGKEELIAEYRESYRGVVTGLHDIFPTVLHLIGEQVPLGIYGTHAFVPMTEKPAQPFRRRIYALLYQGGLYHDSRITLLGDKQGPLFNPVKTSITEAEYRTMYAQIVEVMMTHRAIFDNAAQHLLPKEPKDQSR